MTIEKVAFLGFADSIPSDPEFKEAFKTAKVLAQNGYTIINGGGPGVMKASSLGAHAGGGKAIGITFYPEDMPSFEGRDDSNPIDEEIKTSSYVERTLKIMEMADVYIVFNGGTGTVSEFGMAWALGRLYFGKHKHMVLYGAYWHSIMEAFAANMRIREEELNRGFQKIYHIVDSPTEVLYRVDMLKNE